MALRVVLGIDGSDSATSAVRFVAAFPFPSGTEVTVVSVLKDVIRADQLDELSVQGRGVFDDAVATLRADTSALLEEEAAVLRDAGYEVATEIRSGHPAGEIIDAADERDADLVVVGSHGRTGVKRFLLGSVSSHVLRSADHSVLIVRDGAEAHDHPWRILVGYDESAASDRAVDLCSSLQLGSGDAVRLLTVLPMVHMFRQDIGQEFDPIWRQGKDASKAALEAAADRVRQAGADVTTSLIEAEDVSHAILDAADAFDADLVVLGNKGDSAIKGLIVGSVTSRTAHHTRGSVLAVR